MQRYTRLLLPAVASLGIAACADDTLTDETAAPRMGQMPSAQQGAQGGAAEHTAEGTLNSIDSSAGTVNISHGPVASADWPAMTMNFKLADPSAAAALEPGQRIEFHFTIESGMSATVTDIEAAE